MKRWNFETAEQVYKIMRRKKLKTIQIYVSYLFAGTEKHILISGPNLLLVTKLAEFAAE